MKCRKGDLCVIVDAHGERRKFIGQFLTVTEPYFLSNRWFWHYDPPKRFFDDDGGEVLINDSALQPIRPPKKRDETSKPKTLEAA
jgi:hypothetical protein